MGYTSGENAKYFEKCLDFNLIDDLTIFNGSGMAQTTIRRLKMNMNEKLAAFAAVVNNELFDPEYKGGEWMVEAVETQETLEQFEESSKNWNERSAMKTGEIAGFSFRSWKTAQAVKGQPRQSMSVIDLGEVRIALPGTDLSVF